MSDCFWKPMAKTNPHPFIMKLQNYSQRFDGGGRRTPASAQCGFSILEVLIALAVLSIGLAGLAVMHFNSLKYVHSAYYRSLASAVALDFEERLWLELADGTETIEHSGEIRYLA